MTSTMQSPSVSSTVGSRSRGPFIAISIVLLSAVFAGSSVQAQTFTVLHTFTGGQDGQNPYYGVISDSAGNLYGSTGEGGAFNQGTIYKLDGAGNETLLYTFTGGTDGAHPGRLIRDTAGNLYGATSRGGDLSCFSGSGCGTIFKLTLTGTLIVISRFSALLDVPGPLARDGAGNLYGTSQTDGTFSWGTIFRVDKNGKKTVLHNFNARDGIGHSGLIRDKAGNLYGTAVIGGSHSNTGTLFKLAPTGKFAVLHTFIPGTDGTLPQSGVIQDPSGNLYGTTWVGGAYNLGTVFKVDAVGNETLLYSFTGVAESNPIAGVIRDSSGNLYGTTYQGDYTHFGEVFKLDPNGNRTVLYTFTGGADGRRPAAPVVRDAAGDLYGTTSEGGDFSCDPLGCGVVFKITP